MRTSTKVFIGATLGFGAGVALSWLVAQDFAANGFLKNHWDTFFQPPRSGTKILALVAALLVFLALPIGIAEWRADARFRREERRLREERPAAEVTPYDASEGKGLLFAEPERRALLLEAAGGFGGPRVVELPLVDPVDPASGSGAADEEAT